MFLSLTINGRLEVLGVFFPFFALFPPLFFLLFSLLRSLLSPTPLSNQPPLSNSSLQPLFLPSVSATSDPNPHPLQSESLQ